MGTACWPYREPGLAGSQEGWSCCWDTGAQPFLVPARGQQQPSHQGQGGHANPTDSGFLCSRKSPAELMPRTCKGGAHYRCNVAGAGRRKPGGVLSFPFALMPWMLWITLWQRHA